MFIEIDHHQFMFFYQHTFIASNIKICSRNDPKIAQCIIESIKLLQPRLAAGQLGSEFNVPVNFNTLIIHLY